MSVSAKERKLSRLAAWDSILAKGGDSEKLAGDPVIHAPVGLGKVLTLGFLATCAAVGAHVIFTGTVWLASEALSNDKEKLKDDTIVVKIEEPKPPELEPIEEVEAETKVEPEPAPKPEPPKPKPKPENKPKPPPKEATPDLPPPPKKIVGLNLGSTVAGGTGPSFATGTSLDGETDSKAVDPSQAARAPEDGSKDGVDAPKTNRKATRIPTAGVKLVKPKPRTRVKPDYPPTLRAQGIEANVVVEVSIDAQGNVTKAKLISGSEYKDMNSQALIAARKEKFSPATRDGVAIPFTITYTIRFRLND